MRAGPDVVVVGGGLIGAAITWRLAHEGHEVSWLVDPAQSGSASAASGAMLAVYSEVSAHDDDAVVGIEVEARSRGLAAWTDWLPDVAAASGRPVAVTQGLYVVAGTGADVAGLAAIRAAAAAHGGTAVSVDPTEVPGLHADAGLEPSQAMYLPGEASVDSAVLLGALTEACRSLPTVLISVDRAIRVEAQGDGSRVTTATGETFDAAQVVLATGVETSALLAGSELDGLLPPMFGGRGVSLLVRAPEPTVACIRTPNRAFACGLHIVPRADGLTYLGATNRLTTQPELDARATLDEINQVSSGVLRELDTRLRRAELVSAAVGYRPVTLDRLPLAGRTAVPAVLVATGTWRNGVVLAPMLADLIAEEIATPGKTSQHPFAVTRPMRPAPLDDAAIARAADGIVTSLLGGAALPAGRALELTALVQAILARELDPDAQHPDRAIVRLLERAPMEEALPLVFDLLTRRR